MWLELRIPSGFVLESETMNAQGCLHGSEPALLVRQALFARFTPPGEFPCKICFRLHERRASPPERDLAQEGWEYSCTHSKGMSLLLRASVRSNPARRARKFPCKSEVKFSPRARASPTKRAWSPPYKHPLDKPIENENKI